MLKWLKNLLTLQARFDELQAAHDRRAVFNGRLHQQNSDLSKALRQQRGKPYKGPTPGEKREIDKLSAKYVEHRTLMQLEHKRQKIIIDQLRDYASDTQFFAVCESVAAMNDEQVNAYRTNKRAKS